MRSVCSLLYPALTTLGLSLEKKAYSICKIRKKERKNG
jgi:hypothetical protein